MWVCPSNRPLDKTSIDVYLCRHADKTSVYIYTLITNCNWDGKNMEILAFLWCQSVSAQQRLRETFRRSGSLVKSPIWNEWAVFESR
jgi:hypothetical protein